jgi:hypothetical protein
MKEKETLRVIAVPGHMIADDLAYRNRNRFRFVGRSPTPVKVDESDSENLEKRFPPMEREYPNDVDHRSYIFRALQKSSLLPCDEFTAQQAKVKFVKAGKEQPSKLSKNVASSAMKGDDR